MIGIYKITNLINNKSYIGQSIHIERRLSEHCFPSKTSQISLAIQKYGKENFDFQVIEECSLKELNEKEKYYIKQYNTIVPNGYNVMEYIDNNITSYNFYNKEIIQNIQNDLLNTSLSLQDIANKYKINVSNVSRINQGQTHVNEEYDYPLRKKTQNHHYCHCCGKQLTSNANYCRDCYKEKASIPLEEMPITRNELKDLIRNRPFLQIGKQFNISDNGVRRWCDKFNLPRTKKEIKSYTDDEWASL